MHAAQISQFHLLTKQLLGAFQIHFYVRYILILPCAHSSITNPLASYEAWKISSLQLALLKYLLFLHEFQHERLIFLFVTNLNKRNNNLK